MSSDKMSSPTSSIDDNPERRVSIPLHRPESMDNTKLSKENIEHSAKENKNVPTSKWKSFLSALPDLKVEVIMFLFMFSGTMRAVSNTTLIMDKVCFVHLGYHPEICRNLSNLTEEKVEVEKLANNYSVGHTLIGILPSALLGIFIGAWSDKYGRKMPIIIALLGMIIDELGSCLCAFFFYTRVEYYYIPAVFTGISGGYVSVMTVLYSYASDVTSFKNRTWKYAVLEVTLGLSMPLGQFVGGLLFRYKGYVPVFLASTSGHVFSLLWVIFILKETTGLDKKETWWKKLANLWSTEHVIASFKATVKKRPNKGKEQILLLILAMSIAVLNFASTMGIGYLYVFHLYGWDNPTYSTVSAVFSVIGTFTMLLAVPIFKYLKLGDAFLGITGTLSLMSKSIGTGLAMKPWLYFIANLTGLLAGLANLGGRSRISKVASQDDLGKVFAFLTASETLLPVAATAVVSQVFNATLKLYPGLIYVILGSLLAVSLAIYIWLSRIPTVDYEKMFNAPAENENIEEDKKDSMT